MLKLAPPPPPHFELAPPLSQKNYIEKAPPLQISTPTPPQGNKKQNIGIFNE